MVNRRGIALPLVACALLVAAALVSGVFLSATLEQRIGENSRWMARAFGAAEAGAYESMRLWNRERLDAPVLELPRRPSPEGTGFYSGSITRLNPDITFLDVTGSPRSASDARVRLGLLLRRRLPPVDVRAALATRGTIQVDDGAVVDGIPQQPPDWAGSGCDSLADTARAGLLLDSTLAPWQSLRNALLERVTTQVAGGTVATWPSLDVDGRCNVSDPLNWGDGRAKDGPCGAYYPIVHVGGDATLTAGHGQGILLVDGNLHFEGSYQFYGLIIVTGTIGGSGVDVQLWGSVVAMNSGATAQQLGGGFAIRYSKCVILNSLRGSAALAPVRSRSWIQLF